MASTASPMSVDAATVALEQVEHAVVAGTATAADLAAAKRALHEARQFEADVAVEQETIDTVRARLEATAGIAAEVERLEGPDVVARIDRYTAAVYAAVDALVEVHLARRELTSGFHGPMRRIRRLADVAKDLPPGVLEVSPLTGFDVQVTTERGVWSSTSLREDVLPPILEDARAVAAGRPPRWHLIHRLRRWHEAGTGVPLPDLTSAADEESAA